MSSTGAGFSSCARVCFGHASGRRTGKGETRESTAAIALNGRRAARRQPPSGVAAASSEPPCAPTRSRKPRRPFPVPTTASVRGAAAFVTSSRSAPARVRTTIATGAPAA